MQLPDCRTPITGRPDASYDCFEIMQRKGRRQDLRYFDPYPIPRTASPTYKIFPDSRGGHSSGGASLLCLPSAWQKSKAISLFLQNPCSVFLFGLGAQGSQHFGSKERRLELRRGIWATSGFQSSLF